MLGFIHLFSDFFAHDITRWVLRLPLPLQLGIIPSDTWETIWDAGDPTQALSFPEVTNDGKHQMVSIQMEAAVFFILLQRISGLT